MPTWLARLISLAERRPFAAIALLWLAVALPGLGSGWLWDRDETWYASSALNMVLTGDWIVPAAGDRVFLEKPPLGYWAMAAGFKVLGVGEFAARLQSVLFGLGTLWLVFALAARHDGTRWGLAAAGFLGTTLMFTVLFRMAMLDPAMVFGMTGGLVAFWMLQDMRPGEERRAPWLCLLGGVAVGIAFLAKGPLGLLPGFLALVHMIVARDFALFRNARWWLLLGLAAILAVGLPWYIAVWARTGDDFVSEFILEQNLSRFTNPIQGHEGPFYYYIPVLLVTLLPWTPLALAAPFRRRAHDRVDLFLAVWGLLPILLFSLMATKLIHYIAPCFPALAILLAREARWRIEQGAAAPRAALWGPWLMAIVGIVIIGAAIASLVLFEGFPAWALLVPGLVGATGFAAAGIAARRLAPSGSLLLTGATMAAMAMLVVVLALGPLSRVQALPAAAITMQQRARAIEDAGGEARLFTFAMFEPSLFYYTRGEMQNGRERELASALFDLPPGGTLLVLCRERHVNNVEKLLPFRHDLSTTEVTTLRLRSERLREQFRKEERISVRVVEIRRPPLPM